jgi:outer membrane receptor protein involved in Fe transport
LSLHPEHLQTFELQVGRRLPFGDLNVTFFNNAYRDLIKEILVARIETPGVARMINDEYSINAQRSTIRGIELFAQAYPVDRVGVTVGVSRLFSATETIGTLDAAIVPSVDVTPGRTDVPFLARDTVNVLLDYRLTRRGDRVGVNATGLSRRSVPSDYQSKVPAANRDASNAAGFVRVDAFSTIHLVRHFDVGVRALNLFDRPIFSPPFDNATGYDAQWSGRAVRAELRIRY